jgi:hypothetical protein
MVVAVVCMYLFVDDHDDDAVDFGGDAIAPTKTREAT